MGPFNFSASLTFRFENIFDDETGAYDEDWENYSREE